MWKMVSVFADTVAEFRTKISIEKKLYCDILLPRRKFSTKVMSSGPSFVDVVNILNVVNAAALPPGKYVT